MQPADGPGAVVRRDPGASGSEGRTPWWPAVVVFLAAATLHLYTAGFQDDHYDRITRARQIAVYGEMPFRDFLDPGYGLTLYLSAGLQTLFGDRLIADALLSVAGLSIGFSLLYLLAARISGSTLLALGLTVLTVIAEPRFYDFDKVFFYALGLWACWAYAACPSRRQLFGMAIVTVVAGLFRYDNGLFVGAASVAALVAAHRGHRADISRRAAVFGAATALAAAPAALLLATHGVLLDAAEQVARYAVTEGRRTSVFRPAAVVVDRSAPWISIADPPPDLPLVRVRWDSGLADVDRRHLEREYGLVHSRHDTGATWWYRMQPPGAALVRQIVEDPRIRETAGIDRRLSAVPGLPEPALDTWQRRLPWLGIELLPGWRNADNAVAFLYYLFLLLPLVAMLALWRHRREAPGLVAAERARVLSASVLCFLVTLFILRNPLEARIGAVALPVSVVAAGLFRHRPPARRVEAWASRLVLLGLTLASLLALTRWGWRLTRGDSVPDFSTIRERAARQVALLTESPPSLELTPRWTDVPLVEYLRRCSRPADPILATWFAPHLYYFAGRPFAGGMVVFFGDHWAELKYQRRTIERLLARPPAIVIIEERSYDEFRTTYPFVDRHLQVHYDAGGETDFGNPDVGPRGYRLLVRRTPAPRSVDPRWGLPCFDNR